MVRECQHIVSQVPPKSTDSTEIKRRDEIRGKIEKLNQGNNDWGWSLCYPFKHQNKLVYYFFYRFCEKSRNAGKFIVTVAF